ncbi:MAG: hypothetical protein ACI4JS_09470 [Oscillospiraceae bacterium]
MRLFESGSTAFRERRHGFSRATARLFESDGTVIRRMTVWLFGNDGTNTNKDR